MDNICFLILHYNSIEETINCVSSIKKLNSQNYKINIVIVDNGSSNNTGIQLKEKYKNDENITIIINENNYGFSRGNNIGFKYCKEKFNPKYIIVTNNDVIFNQKDTIITLDKLNDKYKFDVYGPDIFSSRKFWHQSPQKLNYLDSKMTKDELSRLENDLSCYENNILAKSEKKKLSNLIKNDSFIYIFIKKLSLLLNINNTNNYKVPQSNVVIHGACIIFSNSYISKFDNCFEPETFLYWEEDLLLLKCLKHNLKIIYDPKIQVLHLEEGSTKTQESNLEKMKFKTKEMIKSGKIYLNEVLKFEKENLNT